MSEIAQEPLPCLRLGLHCRKLGFPSCCSNYLEEAGLPLERAFTILDEAKSNLDSIAGQKGLLLQNNFNSVLERNPDVLVLRSIVGCLEGEEGSLPEAFGPGDVANFKFYPTANIAWREPFWSTKLC